MKDRPRRRRASIFFEPSSKKKQQKRRQKKMVLVVFVALILQFYDSYRSHSVLSHSLTPSLIHSFTWRLPLPSSPLISTFLVLGPMLPFSSSQRSGRNEYNFPDFIRRMCDFRQMDFESAFDQIFHLLSIDPQRVYISFYHRKRE
jgi:hypothetical protein